MTRTRVITTIGMLVVTATFTTSNARAQHAPVTLHRVYTAGEVQQFKSVVRVLPSGTQFTATSRVTVREVRSNGDAVELYEDLGGTVISGAGSQSQPPGPPFIETRSSDGKLLDYQTQQNSKVQPQSWQRLVVALGDIFWPSKPVSPGDSWQTNFDNPAAKGTIAVVTSTFLGSETIDGSSRYKIKQTCKVAANSNGAVLLYDFTAWVTPDTGRMVKAIESLKNLPTQSGTIGLESTVTGEKLAR